MTFRVSQSVTFKVKLMQIMLYIAFHCLMYNQHIIMVKESTGDIVFDLWPFVQGHLCHSDFQVQTNHAISPLLLPVETQGVLPSY